MTEPCVGLSFRAIERLLKPGSIAIVGASPSPGALGASVLANLDRMAYPGEIYLVNPKRELIGGRPCLKSVSDLPLNVDCAVLAIPQAAVLETVRNLVSRRVGAVIIFSAGFGESGAAGMADQRELSNLALTCGMIIEGPNCLGLVNYVDSIALTFVEVATVALGNRPAIGIVSQSGAMAAVAGVILLAKGLGISYSISTGNEAASGVEDYLEYLVEDPRTNVIALIVEQFRQPGRFLKLARRARVLQKAIVLLHPGRSGAARESAATHTGAMAGDYLVMRTQVERQGVLVTENLEEFADCLEMSLRFGSARSRGAAVLTESGAFKALTLDLCEQIGLALPVLTDETAPLLRAALPSFVPVSNPVDLTAQGLVDPELYRRSLEALIHDQRFGSVILGIIQTDAKTSAVKFPPIIRAIKELKPTKAIIFAGLDDGAQVPDDYIEGLRALNVSYFRSPSRAFKAAALWHAAAERDVRVSDPVDRLTFEQLPPTGVLSEHESKQLLSRHGISFPASRLVTTLEEAQQAAAQLSAPVVLKAQSAALSHKSEAGGVILGLRDAQSIAEGWERLRTNIFRHRPDLVLDGVLVERMSTPGVELIIGGRNDPDWGCSVLVGFGGVQAEILKDVRLLASDLSIDGILRELDLLKSAPLLRGFRGAPPLDVVAVAHMILRVAALMRSAPRIREIDLNPVIIYPLGEGAIALDALVIVG